VGIPETNEKFERASKNQIGLYTQKFSQGILRTQRQTNQEKNENRANGHRKFKKPKIQKG
jgi:hypothetical protein